VDIEDGAILPARVNGLPVVRKSSIGTQARISENEALVIAGYNSSDQRLNMVSTPFLSKIPVLGALFRSRGTSDKRTERLFVIYPTMIDVPPPPVYDAKEANDSAVLNAPPRSNGSVTAATAATATGFTRSADAPVRVTPNDQLSPSGSLSGNEVVVKPVSVASPVSSSARDARASEALAKAEAAWRAMPTQQPTSGEGNR